jgi:hypothetical protein
MIPIPSVFFFEECYPPVGEVRYRRRMNENRQQQQQQQQQHHYSSNVSRPSSQPPVPAPPLRLRQVIEIEPPRRRYDYDGFTNPKARFWELQQQEERQQSQHNNNKNEGGGGPNTKLIVSIRKKSQLCIFLSILIPFILVDEWSLLPAGTILYITALSIAWENWMNELEQDQLFIQQLKNQRNKRNKLQYEIDKAKFEYHVLKNKPNIDIKVILNKNNKHQHHHQQQQQQLTDDDINNNDFDTKWIIYAEERRQ